MAQRHRIRRAEEGEGEGCLRAGHRPLGCGKYRLGSVREGCRAAQGDRMSPEHLVRLRYDAGDFGGFREHAIEQHSSSLCHCSCLYRCYSKAS
jgi:hypothetical protein